MKKTTIHLKYISKIFVILLKNCKIEQLKTNLNQYFAKNNLFQENFIKSKKIGNSLSIYDFSKKLEHIVHIKFHQINL